MDSPLDDLNTYLQRKKKTKFLSWLDEESGPKHDVLWTSTCKLHDIGIGTGSAKTKRQARTAAAREALAALNAQEAAVAAS